MNDELKYPSHDLMLKLQWPIAHDHLADGQRVVVELQSANGLTVTSLSVPSDQLVQAGSQKLRFYPLISLDGIVSVVSEDFIGALLEDQTIAFDQLIAEAIAPEMLEDEPEAPQMLAKFRDRLLKSLEHVEQAIASLPKD